MRRIVRGVQVVVLLIAVSVGSVFAGPNDDGAAGRQIRKEAHRSFIQRILDYLDSKISLPPG
jgi:hypothetical protein